MENAQKITISFCSFPISFLLKRKKNTPRIEDTHQHALFSASLDSTICNFFHVCLFCSSRWHQMKTTEEKKLEKTGTKNCHTIQACQIFRKLWYCLVLRIEYQTTTSVMFHNIFQVPFDRMWFLSTIRAFLLRFFSSLCRMHFI
jgi:hypothetical protein